MAVSRILPVLVTTLGIVCSAKGMDKRQSSKVFSLYAYGEPINGLEVFYADGQAQIGDITVSQAINKVPIYITHSDSKSNTWIAHANTTQSSDATFKTYGTGMPTNVLCLKQTDSWASPVGFTTPDNSTGVITDTWRLYGETVLLNEANANFYARPTDNLDLYSLLWSTTQSASLHNIPISLRTVAPVTD